MQGGDVKVVKLEPAAIVNGEVISVSELDNAFASLSAQYGNTVVRKDVLDQLVQSEIVYQEVKNLGALASDEEARANFQDAKTASGITTERIS